MSQAELERFVAVAQNAPEIVEAYRTATTTAELATLLRRDGYDVTEGELDEIARRGSELSDEQLDQVSGGIGVAAVIAALGVGAVAMGLYGGLTYVAGVATATLFPLNKSKSS